MDSKPRIVVLGAGYAGLLATVRLARRQRDAEIVLVNPVDSFVERLRLHQYAANQEIKRRPLAAPLRGTGVEVALGRATWIDRASRTVTIEDADGARSALPYDYLLYALGSFTERSSVAGVAEHAYALEASGPLSAEALRASLPDLAGRGAALAVVGGGATGIEAAAEFAESYPALRVTLITGGPLVAPLGEAVAAKIRNRLRRLGVTVIEHTVVRSVGADRLITEDGGIMPVDACLWAGGFAVPSLARDAGLSVNERGQALIDPFMRSISDPRIFVAGDAAFPVVQPGALVRMAAGTAALMGAHAADCLDNALRGRPQQPFGFSYAGQGIALGRHQAVGFSNYPDDVPHRPILTGWIAVRLREFFVNLLANSARLERHGPGFSYWPGKGRGRLGVAAEGPAAELLPVTQESEG